MHPHPPHLLRYGFGEQGSFSFPAVPPRSRLVYEVELVQWEESSALEEVGRAEVQRGRDRVHSGRWSQGWGRITSEKVGVYDTLPPLAACMQGEDQETGLMYEERLEHPPPSLHACRARIRRRG